MDDLAISAEELAQVMGTARDKKIPEQAQKKPDTDFSETIGEATETSVTARPAEFAPLTPPDSVSSSTNIDLLLGVSLRVTVELGRTKMKIEEILQLGPGSVIELDKLAGEPVDMLVNDRLIARGEVVVLDDRFGVRVTDVIPPAQRIDSLS